MPGHTDILDEPERLRGAFWGSLALHAGMIGLTLGAAVLHSGNAINLGDKDGGRFGAVAVNSVATIPVWSQGPKNPVANDTESMVPAPPAAKKVKPKVQAPDPNAIAIKMKNAPNKKYQERASAQPNKWQDQQQYRPNQTYSTAGQAASSPMYQLPGGGGVGAGTTNPFGDQYGAYANLLYQRFAQSWHTQDVDARVTSAPPVLITFAMLRDGSLVPGSVRVVQSSGNSAIDRSAQRAVYDAADTRLPPLPPGLNRDRVDVNLRFELRR